MQQSAEVLVVGGGVVGLTAALAMAQRRHSVAVLDAKALQVDLSVPDLRVYAINKTSQALLSSLGVWQHIDNSRMSPYNKMHVWDGVNGSFIDFDSRTVAAAQLGTIVEESVLKHALLQTIAAESAITLFADCQVDAVDEMEQSIRVCSQDAVWEGELLMIADGANSPVRSKLQVPFTTWSYKQQALVATVAIEKPHQATAYQVFHPESTLAFLPLANPQHCSIVWSCDSDKAQQLMALDDEAFNTQLTRAFANQLGEVRLMTCRHQFPLHMRHVKQYTGKRWMLLGDAAHTIHPLAGLGLNLGLADVRSWLDSLDKTRGRSLSARALGAYQRERKASVWQSILLMDGLKRIFGTDFPPLVALRGMGLRFCDSMSPLKQLFIRHADGG